MPRRDLADVQPSVVEAYLKSKGWTQYPSQDPNITNWERGEACTSIPQRPAFADYGRRLREAVGVISCVESRDPTDLTQELVQGAVTWRYVVPNVKGEGWGIFLLDSSGMFAVVSDFGSYAFKWADWGQGDFRAFLVQLDKGYLCGKLAMGRSKEYQGKETLDNIRDQILQRRRDGSLDKETARAEWKLAEKVDSHYAEDFAEWLHDTKLGADSYELSVYDTPGQIRMFYDRVFKRLVPILKQDLDP